MLQVKFHKGESLPLEMHRVRVVQKLNLLPIDERLAAITERGFNTFRLKTKSIFLDMLTDSGVNALSSEQMSAMERADEAYAGSQSFERLEEVINDVLGLKYVLPVHQGRAAENIISRFFVKEGSVVPMNYHFTTTLAHIMENKGRVEEIFTSKATVADSDEPFKGDMDIEKLEALIAEHGTENIPYVRMEASTNLIGGQPFSMQNMRKVREVTRKNGLLLVLDASLMAENAYFIKVREKGFEDWTLKEIFKALCSLADITYFSSRKFGSAKGGAICMNNKEIFDKMGVMIPLFEGFFTYGGIPIRDVEAMAQGITELTDESVVSQSPQFIQYLVSQLQKEGIPVIAPGGALGCHVNAGEFLPHISQEEYPAGALASAFYIISGVRGMERGTLSNVRDENGNNILADIELMRLAFPRRVFTLSQTRYVLDRLIWLFENRDLVGGLRFVNEPPIMRFFNGELEPTSDWPQKLVAKFKADFGESL